VLNLSRTAKVSSLEEEIIDEGDDRDHHKVFRAAEEGWTTVQSHKLRNKGPAGGFQVNGELEHGSDQGIHS